MTAVLNPSRATSATVALLEAKRRYVSRHPTSEQRWGVASESMPGGNTRTVLFYEPFPLCMATGAGCSLVDVDGHAYVDLLGEYTAGLYGHSNPIIRAAVIAALENGISLSAHNQAEALLARAICDRFASIDLVRFTNSGTEANLMALATALAHTKRRRILVFNGAYHGGVLTFGATPSATTVPHDFLVAPYNDVAATRGLIRENAGALAAILVEPMLGAGGCLPGTEDFLGMLASESRAAGAVLIFDEIQTSRLSSGGRQKLLGITPDLTTLGKYLGGGLSFGAFGGRSDLMSQFDPRRPGFLAHAGTFNNNVLSMAAGYAGLSQILTPGVLEALNERGDALRSDLNTLCRTTRSRLHLTGLGSLMNFHASGPDERTIVELLFFDLLERGFYSSPRGLVALSLAVGRTETDGFASALREIIVSRPSVYC